VVRTGGTAGTAGTGGTGGTGGGAVVGGVIAAQVPLATCIADGAFPHAGSNLPTVLLPLCLDAFVHSSLDRTLAQRTERTKAQEALGRKCHLPHFGCRDSDLGKELPEDVRSSYYFNLGSQQWKRRNDSPSTGRTDITCCLPSMFSCCREGRQNTCT